MEEKGKEPESETVDSIREMASSHTGLRISLSGKVVGKVKNATKRLKKTRSNDLGGISVHEPGSGSDRSPVGN